MCSRGGAERGGGFRTAVILCPSPALPKVTDLIVIWCLTCYLCVIRASARDAFAPVSIADSTTKNPELSEWSFRSGLLNDYFLLTLFMARAGPSATIALAASAARAMISGTAFRSSPRKGLKT